MTEHQPRADVTAILEGAGVDLDAVAQRRELALTATAPVLGAAQAVIDHRGEPNASARVHALSVALEDLVAHDPVSAVVVAAAVWLDRYGSAGAPELLQDLQEAVDGLRGGTLGMTLEDAVERGAFTGRPEHLSDLFDDGPPCDTDPAAHEERLAYLEPDDGQDDDPAISYGR
jgi:hypothetical protein